MSYRPAISPMLCDLSDWNRGVDHVEAHPDCLVCAVCGTSSSPEFYFRDSIAFDPAYGFVCHAHRYSEGHLYRRFYGSVPARGGRKVWQVKARSGAEAIAFINWFGDTASPDNIKLLDASELTEREVANLIDLDEKTGSNLQVMWNEEERPMALKPKVKTDYVMPKQPIEVEHVPPVVINTEELESFWLDEQRKIVLETVQPEGGELTYRIVIHGGLRAWSRKLADRETAQSWLDSYKKLHYSRAADGKGGLYRASSVEGVYNVELKTKEFTDEDGKTVDVISKYVVTLEAATEVHELGEYDTLFAARKAAQAEHEVWLKKPPVTVTTDMTDKPLDELTEMINPKPAAKKPRARKARKAS